jgi:hypothetical protein
MDLMVEVLNPPFLPNYAITPMTTHPTLLVHSQRKNCCAAQLIKFIELVVLVAAPSREKLDHTLLLAQIEQNVNNNVQCRSTNPAQVSLQKPNEIPSIHH